MNITPEASPASMLHSVAGTATHQVPADTLQSLSLSSMFWRPTYFRESPWLEHLPFAFWLTEASRPKVMVELGAGNGLSYFGFCQAVERLRLDTRCYAVDLADEPEALPAGSPAPVGLASHNELHYAAFSRRLTGGRDDALARFAPGSVDLLHLHDWALVDEELDGWLPKLSPRAVVLMHGTERHGATAKLATAFSMLRQRYPHFEFPHGDGLGVLGVGTALPPLLQQLFASSTNTPVRHAVNEVFARLGRACADQHTAHTQRLRADELARQVGAQQRRIEDTDSMLDKIRTELTARTREIGLLRERLGHLSEQQAVERGQLSERVQLLQEWREDLKEECQRLREALANRTAEPPPLPDLRVQAELASLVAARQADVAVMARQLQALEQARDAAEQSEREAQCRSDAAESALAMEHDALAAAQAEREAMADACTQLRAEQASLQQALLASEEEKARLTQTAEAARREADVHHWRWNAERDQLLQRLSALEAAQEVRLQRMRVELADAGVEQHKAELARLNQELSDSQAQLHAQRQLWQHQLEAAQARFEGVLTERRADREALDAAHADAEILMVEIVELRAELQRAGQHHQAERATLMQARNDAAAQAQAAASTLASREQTLSRKDKELKAALAEQKKLQDAVIARDQARAKKDKNHAEQVAALQAELKQLRAAAAQKDKDQEALQRARTDAEVALKSRFQEIAALTSRLTESDRHRQETETQLAEATQRHADTEAQLASERALHAHALAQAQAQAEAQQKRVQALKRSVSWRVTAPLRYAGAQLRPRRTPEGNEQASALAALRHCGLFDAEWYLARYPDVMATNMDPLQHYLRFGAAERRDPAPGFSTAAYIAANPDVSTSGMNPLLHYVQRGRPEGRTATPVQH
jgi:predicted  nucleic acid-binding Zn-ribbon protein